MMLTVLHNDLVYAIGMTIIHSTWQITLIYLVMQVVLRMLSGSPAVVKYRVAGISMLMSVVFSVITFFICYSPPEKELAGMSGLLSMAAVHPVNTGASPLILPKPATGYSWANSVLPYIVAVYFSGLLIMSLRILTGSAYIRQHAKKGVFTPPETVMSRFRNLCDKMMVSRRIRLLESVRVNIPEVLGYLKPVIIVPAGFFNNMPFEQAEAILAHELAHIQRKDFLINIFQSVIEILFFYHPAIYLISSRIRHEREVCCDDMALAYCPEKETYARALARMAENRLTPSYPAVAIMRNRRHLLERIKRILKQENMKTKISDKLFAGVIILAGFSLIILTGAAALNNFNLHSSDMGKNFSLNIMGHPGQGTAISDSLIHVDEQSVIIQQKDDKGKSHNYEMKFKNQKLSSLKVDGKIIPESRYGEYKDIIKKTLDSVTKTSADVQKAGDKLDKINKEEIVVEVKKALDDVKKIDTAKIAREIKIAITSVSNDSLRAQLEKARQQLNSINMDSLKLTMKNNLSEKEMEQIRSEMEKARKALEQDRIRLDIEKSKMLSQQHGPDSLRILMDKTLSGIDWNQIEATLSKGLDSTFINLDLKLKDFDLEKMQKELDNIDWDQIMSSVDKANQSASIILRDSVKVYINDLDIPSMEESIRQALESIENLDKDRALKDLGETGEKLEKARENLENTLRELEKQK